MELRTANARIDTIVLTQSLGADEDTVRAVQLIGDEAKAIIHEIIETVTRHIDREMDEAVEIVRDAA